MDRQTFDAVLIKDDDTNGAGIKIPFDVQAAFGAKGRIKVCGTIDGYPYRGSLHPYGGIHYMGVRKEIRDAIGKDHGDIVSVVMEVDDIPRIVAVPDDLMSALGTDKKALAAFEKMSYSHKSEYVKWIEDAKKPETRKRRIEKTLEKITGA